MKFNPLKKICGRTKNKTRGKYQKNPWRSEFNDILRGGCGEAGAFIFSQNPEKGNLILRIASYKSP